MSDSLLFEVQLAQRSLCRKVFSHHGSTVDKECTLNDILTGKTASLSFRRYKSSNCPQESVLNVGGCGGCQVSVIECVFLDPRMSSRTNSIQRVMGYSISTTYAAIQKVLSGLVQL